MSNIKLYIVCWLLLVISIYCVQCCGPAEIGQKYIITSTANVRPDYSVQWQLGNTVILYGSSLPVPNRYPNLYLGTRTQLTINTVTTNDGANVFQHLVRVSVEYACALPVYKRASTPTCESVTLNGNQIRTTCTTAQVFPQAKCQFTLQNGGLDRRHIVDGTPYITYTHTAPEVGENEYYSTSCTLQYLANGFKPGNWTVQVNMYPDLAGVSVAQGTVGQAGNVLLLSVPTVNINTTTCPKGLAEEGNTNVRQGYTRQGERASCECTRAHAGNPPGTIGWRSTQGGNFAYLSRSADTATIQINSPGTFTCQSISVLDGSHSDTYTPKYAYGPSSATLAFQRTGPIYLCPNQQTNIDITCQVLENSFNPTTLFTIQDDNNNNLINKHPGDTARSKTINYNFTKPGQHTFSCRVENAVFSDMFSEAPASAIQVYVPPNRPPSFQVTGQSVITDSSEPWVKQGSDIHVSCLAGEAYPSVKSVNVTCGQVTSSSGQLFVCGVSDDELACQCEVDHETKTSCNGLNLYTEIIMQSAYGPNEVSIRLTDDQLKELPNEPISLCSSEDIHSTIICAVKQSDVRPGLTMKEFILTKPSSMTTKQMYLDTSNGYYRFVNTLKINSGGNYTLICDARNPKFTDLMQTQSMTIEARKPPTTPPVVSARSRQNGDVLVQGDDVTISCSVYGGYPSVHSVTLTCGQNHSVKSDGTSADITLNSVGPSNSVINCICLATHVTGCYDLMGVLPLNILSVNPNKAEGDTSPMTTAEITGTAIGGIVGILVLVAVIALIVFLIRRAKEKSRNRTKDTEYDKVRRQAPLPYQNVKSLDPTYQTVNPAERTPNSASANQETERTYNNQAYGDYEEPIEPDPNVYSDIHDT